MERIGGFLHLLDTNADRLAYRTFVLVIWNYWVDSLLD